VASGAGAERRIRPKTLKQPRERHRDERGDRAAREQGERDRRGDATVAPPDEREGNERGPEDRAGDGAGHELAQRATCRTVTPAESPWMRTASV
jgi:hypothetical protein